MKTVSVVIPFLNEEENLPELIERLLNQRKRCTGHRLEFVFVDDGSVDRSVTLIESTLAEVSDWKIVQLMGNFGQQRA